MPLRGKRLRLFCVCLGCVTPPPRKSYCLLRVCFIDEASGEYTVREVWQKVHRGGGHRGGGIHHVWGYEAPQSMCDATAAWVQSYAPKGARPTKHTKRGPEVVVVEPDAPPTPKGKAPTPSPKPSKVAKVAAQPPPRPLMWRPWGPVWPPS